MDHISCFKHEITSALVTGIIEQILQPKISCRAPLIKIFEIIICRIADFLHVLDILWLFACLRPSRMWIVFYGFLAKFYQCFVHNWIIPEGHLILIIFHWWMVVEIQAKIDTYSLIYLLMWHSQYINLFSDDLSLPTH